MSKPLRFGVMRRHSSLRSGGYGAGGEVFIEISEEAMKWLKKHLESLDAPPFGVYQSLISVEDLQKNLQYAREILRVLQ